METAGILLLLVLLILFVILVFLLIFLSMPQLVAWSSQ